MIRTSVNRYVFDVESEKSFLRREEFLAEGSFFLINSQLNMTDKGNFQKSVQEREKNFSCASHNNLRNIISSLFLQSYFCVKDDSRIVRGTLCPNFFLVKEIGVKLVRYGHYAMEFDKICGTKRPSLCKSKFDLPHAYSERET